LSETIFRSNSHSFVAFFVIIPFIISSIVAILVEWEKDNYKVNYKRVMKEGSLAFMIWGFFHFLQLRYWVFLGLINFIPN
jgi:hypothetical protein